MTDPCLFCDIAQGRVRAHEVHRGARVVAFLDIAPIREGHVQIVPHDHYPCFEDLPRALAHEIMELGQTVARVQKMLFSVPRVGFLFTGGDIAHAHAHVVPLHEKTDITSSRYIATAPLCFRQLPRAAEPALAHTAAALRAAIKEA